MQRANAKLFLYFYFSIGMDNYPFGWIQARFTSAWIIIHSNGKIRKNKKYDESEQRSFRYINSYASRTLAIFPDEYPPKPVNIPPKSIINPVPVDGYFKEAPRVGRREARRY